MEPTDLTIEILKGIRDEVRGVREEVRDQIQGLRVEIRSVRVDLGGEIQGLREEVHGIRDHMNEMDIRLSTEVVAFTGVVRQLSEQLRTDRSLRTRVDDHEQRLGALEERTR